MEIDTELEQKFKNYFKLLPLYVEDLSGMGARKFSDWLAENEFFKQPASTKWHGAYESGLLHHTLNVTDYLVKFTKEFGLQWQRVGSPIVVGLFHDICKYDAYVKTDNGYTWNEHQPLTGHGEKSIMIASQFMTLTEEEIFCIRWHMGAYENKDTWSNMQEAQIKYPNVMWTHHADMLASRDEAREERNK